MNIKTFKLLSEHRKLSKKRKADDKKAKIAFAVFVVITVAITGVWIFPILIENAEIISPVMLSILVTLDFWIRFSVKKHSSSMIFPYLTLPIFRKSLLHFVIVSDLQKFGVWGVALIYLAILVFFNAFTFWNVLFVLLFLLLNNSLIAFAKTQFGKYSILLSPVCFVFVGGLLFLAHLLHPIFTIVLLAVAIYGSLTALYYSLKEKLLKELNSTAL